MFTRNVVLAGVVAALTSAACQPPAQEVGLLSQEDVAAIQNVFEIHRQNALSGDWDADAALYTEDAVRLPPSGTAVRGRTAIQAALTQVDSLLDFTLDSVEIYGRGDLAYVWNSYSTSFVVQGSTEPSTSTGRSLVILQKQPDESWLFHRVIWNSDELPPEECAETES